MTRGSPYICQFCNDEMKPTDEIVVDLTGPGSSLVTVHEECLHQYEAVRLRARGINVVESEV